MDMTPNEQASWAKHSTPVVFNHHAPIEINESTITSIDLNPIKSTPKALANEERILIVTPLKDAAKYLTKYFELITELTYPHELIDLAFLVGDTTDDTLAVLSLEVDRIQKRPDKIPFHSVTIVQKDFNFQLSMDVAERHSFEAQGPRRKAMGRARNYLLATALKPEHSWVYWRDVDIVDSPKKIIEDMVAHDRDIIVPSRFSLAGSTDGAVANLLQIFGSTATRMAGILKEDVSLMLAFIFHFHFANWLRQSTITRGSKPIRVANWRLPLARMSFLPKVDPPLP